MSPEPIITVNGTPLTSAEAMTVRVALETFDMTLAADGLGDDAHGKTMVKLYRTAIRGIRDALYPEVTP